MTEKKIIIGIILLTVLILFGGIFFVSGSSTSGSIVMSQNAKAGIGEKTYNFGKVSYKGKNIVKSFAIKNAGSETLKLTNIRTSCHCTKARVLIGKETSPLFGMNTVSSWIGEIDPGKEGELTVDFDPKYHGINGVGPVERLVSVETNDANNRNLEFSLNGIVIK